MEDKILQSNPLLEALGNAKTLRNSKFIVDIVIKMYCMFRESLSKCRDVGQLNFVLILLSRQLFSLR